MVFDFARNMEIDVTVDAEDAVRTLGDVDNKILTLNQSLEIASKAWNGFTNAAKFAKDALIRGADVGDIAESFQRLSTEAGVTASTFQNRLSQALGETVSKFELQKQAIDALQSGLTPEAYIRITEAARAFAEQGEDLTQVQDALIRSIATGRDMYLKTKGIIIDTAAAEDRFAKSIGTTRDRLNETGKLQAARIAMLDALKTKQAEGNKVTNDAADNLKRLDAIIIDARDRFYEAAANNAKLNQALADLGTALKQIQFDKLIEALGFIIDKSVLAAQGIVNLGKELGRFAGEVKDSGSVSGGAAAYLVKSLFGDYAADELTGIVGGFLQNVVNHVAGIGASASEATPEVVKLGNALQYIATGGDKDVGKAAESMIEEIKKGAEALKKEAEKGGSNSFAAMLGLEDDEALGAAANQVASDFVSMLGPALAGELDAQDIGGAFGSGLGAGIGGWIGGEEGTKIGAQLGGTIGNWIGGLFGSSPNEFDIAKQKVDEYFKSLFDANRITILVHGELVRIKDFVQNEGATLFGSGGKGTNTALFESFGREAQAAFQGVGDAMEYLSGAGEEMGRRLSYVLANNLGDLNNLQIMIQATGLSLQDLESALETTFLNGTISAEELINELLAIRGLMEVGIPGAVGAVDQAWGNFLAAGSKGGRALVDSIRDIGAEAIDLGIKTMPQLAKYLVEVLGYDAQQVALFIKACEAQGIDSMEKLAAASVTTAAVIQRNMTVGAQGGAMISLPETPKPTVSTPRISTPRVSTSSGKSEAERKAEEAKRKREQERKQFNDDLERLITQSAKYADIVQRINDGTLTTEAAQAGINTLYTEGTRILKELNAAQEKADKEIKKYGHTTAETAATIAKLEKQQKEYFKTVSQADKQLEPITQQVYKVNEGLVAFIEKYKDNMSLITIAANVAGIGVDKLKGSLIEAALAGKKTFSEVAAELQNLGPGVAGKTGAVGEALGNMFSHGLRGGRLTVNDLRSLGAEALELGANSNSDLMKALIAQGVSPEDAQKLFFTLQSAGIETMDQLVSVSDESAIKIIASLGQMGLPFKETTDATTKLLEDINNIPASKSIEINVTAVMDDKTRAIFEFLQIPITEIKTDAPSTSAQTYGNSGDAPGIPPGMSAARHTRLHYLEKTYGRAKALSQAKEWGYSTW